ncbi:MAG: diguanylate cyclase [Desulfobacterales bacterium]|nr:diguanylate cyclase [Desulfobacterales bacterium]
MTGNKKKTILVVDDSLTIRMSIKEQLEPEDIDVYLAENGKKCLDVLQHIEPDLILLDIIMPEMDGIAVCQKLKATHQYKNIPILILTTETDVENKVKGLNAGADDYVTKPFEIRELMARINVIIRNQELQKELRQANQKILEQQNSVIEEERLKVLLQMSGATAHEIDQPLTALLTHIDLIESSLDNPEDLMRNIASIKGLGKKISDIVKSIHNIQNVHQITAIGVGMSEPHDPSLNQYSTISILSVEGSDEDFLKIQLHLQEIENMVLKRAINIKQAIQCIESEPYDVVFLDHILPDGNAHDFFQFLGSKNLDIPIIVITGHGDEMIASQMIQAGAYDYISKERVNELTLKNSIHNALTKFHLKQEVKIAMQKMAQMAIKDELTTLYNRRYFDEALQRETSRALRYSNELILCVLDLDHFKRVNDTYGHQAGDMVLSRMGKMLKDNFRQSDLLCRYGGEEFGLIFPNTCIENAFKVCDRFRKELSQVQFDYKGSVFSMTSSIGISNLSTTKYKSPEELICRADKALYIAKGTGRNQVICYKDDHDPEAL